MNHSDPAIDELYQSWREAFRGRDADKILDLCTPDYVLWAPGAPAVGVADLRPRLIAALAAYDVESSFEREERLVSGDLAVERGWDVQVVTPRSGGPARTQRQRVFVVLRRGKDGRWRFARGMTHAGPEATPLS